MGWNCLEVCDLLFPQHLEYIELEVRNSIQLSRLQLWSLVMPIHRQLNLHEGLLAEGLFLCVMVSLLKANLS